MKRADRVFSCLLLVALALLLPARSAQAKPEFPNIVAATYTLKPGGVLASAGCNLCHTSPPKLNPYGRALKPALGPNETLTAESLRQIESADSDGDGFSNLAEFQADTLPGDPNSKPAGPLPGSSAAPDSGAPPTVGTNSAPPAGAATGAEDLGLFHWKTLLLPKHAQHRVLVHFPIALLIIGLFFDFLGWRSRNAAFYSAGYYNLALAALTAPLAVVTGLLAWRFAFGGMALTENPYLLYHLILGVATMLVTFGLWGIRFRSGGANSEPNSPLYLVLALLALGLIFFTGHIGGALVDGG